jgi:hypothetical protein
MPTRELRVTFNNPYIQLYYKVMQAAKYKSSADRTGVYIDILYIKRKKNEC